MTLLALRRNLGNRKWGRFLASAACVLLAFSAGHRTALRMRDVPDDVLLKRIQLAPGNNRARHDELVNLFTEAGCTPTEDKVPGQPSNIVCTMPGEIDSVIVVGAHFDKAHDGKGVVDNWSGASLLPSMFQSLNLGKRCHTIVFVGFSGEEEGRLGSDAYVHHLSKAERAKIHAMIAIDTLGLAATEVWPSHDDHSLLRLLENVAYSLKLPVAGMDMDYVGDTDSTSFKKVYVPTVTFHSLTPKTLGILHTDKDTYAAVNEKEYLQSCRLITAYVAYLDEALDKDKP